jgi:SAM-dependent methyltransferase
VFSLVIGCSLSTDGGDELDSRRFTKAMHALGMLGEAEALAQTVDLAGRRDLVDVGCGSGVYSLTLCGRYRELRATLLDRPEVLEVTSENVAESGLGDRVTLISGDFLRDSYGVTRDVVLLSDVLYQSDEACVAMLREAYRALVPGGLVVIRGYYPDPRNNRSAFAALFDLDRLLWDDARRPLPASRVIAWLDEVGFKGARSFALTELSTGIVAEK